MNNCATIPLVWRSSMISFYNSLLCKSRFVYDPCQAVTISTCTRSFTRFVMVYGRALPPKLRSWSHWIRQKIRSCLYWFLSTNLWCHEHTFLDNTIGLGFKKTPIFIFLCHILIRFFTDAHLYTHICIMLMYIGESYSSWWSCDRRMYDSCN